MVFAILAVAVLKVMSSELLNDFYIFFFGLHMRFLPVFFMKMQKAAIPF